MFAPAPSQIVMYLDPLRPMVDEIEQTDFETLDSIVAQIMHCVTLTWKHSVHYSTPRRIVIFLRELFNELICSVINFVEPRSVYGLEPQDNAAKIVEALRVMNAIEAVYHQFREKVNVDKESGPWEFQNELVLNRFRGFIARAEKLLNVANIRVDFEKLEKIELSNTDHQSAVKGCETSFLEAYEKWIKMTGEEAPGCYDPLEPTSVQFEVDYQAFLANVRDYDLQIGSVAGQVFDDQQSLEGYNRVVHAFMGLLSRPTIEAEIKDRYESMAVMFTDELDAVTEFYNSYDTNPAVSKNMPNVAGALECSRRLRNRITAFYKQQQALGRDGVAAFNTPEAATGYKDYSEMMELLRARDKTLFTKWAKAVGEQSDLNLNKKVLNRDPETRHMTINFDPQLVSVLREVKYFELMQEDQITMPEEAQAIYARNETFRQFLGNLGIVVVEYNRIQSTLLDVEAPLMVRELSSADEKLEQAVANLTWNTEGLGAYCAELKSEVEALSNRLFDTKERLSLVTTSLEGLYAAPMLLRDAKTGKLPYANRLHKLKPSYARVTDAGVAFIEAVKFNAKSFRADQNSDIWKDYLRYVDGMIIDGLFNVIFTTINHILDCMDGTVEGDEASDLPLLAGRLELTIPNCNFSPSMAIEREAAGEGEELDASLSDWMEQLMDNVFHVGELVPRIATAAGETLSYRESLEASDDLVALKEELIYKAQTVMSKAQDYRDAYMQEYSGLWTEDIPAFMESFLKYGKVLTQEELEAWAEENDTAPFPESPPTLEQFKAEIDKYSAISEKILGLEDSITFEKWFKVDTTPFKKSLHAVSKKWVDAFIDHLKGKVTQSLVDLEEFSGKAVVGLQASVPEGNYEALVGVLNFINAVNERREKTDTMFEPLKDTVTLLAGYDITLPDAILAKLETLPDVWANTVKVCGQTGSDIAPIQAEEVTVLKKRANKFDIRNFEFREDFLKRAPIRYQATDCYNRINSHYDEYMMMEVEMSDLEERADLLRVQLPEYKQLRACRKELGFLKIMWDVIYFVRFQFDAWAKTLWAEVNCETMDTSCKKMNKDIRGLPKEVRAWEAFNGIDAEVKNMITSLGAVQLLQDPAIRERHWQQVMDVTGVTIEMNAKTVLDDLLKLQLHEYEDDVATIVDRAKKELQMEKMIVELEKVWSEFEFEFGEHKRTGLPQVKVAEEMIEVLEDNQVNLQNLLASKFIAHFKEQVGSWSNKLSTTDQVIEIWLEVQRTWSNLESIFIGSEDIRAQLPKDAKRFDGIDVDFKELVTRSGNIPNVVDCTNQPKMFDQLEDMQERLTLCEKALNEYLDTKRLAFPRFYFVSSADLLDILSNGNNPAVVAKQLSKLFCSINNLTIPDAEAGKKDATHMIALDGEIVEFRNQEGAGALCDCSGRVEEWLMTVQTIMQETLRWACKDALTAYEERPRDQWVFEWPAQVALVGTQVWWATEVNLAFGRLEEGCKDLDKLTKPAHLALLPPIITSLAACYITCSVA